MMRGLIATILLFMGFASYAQLSVSVDAVPDSIYFGDEVTLDYKVNVPADVDLTSLDFGPLLSILNAAYAQDSTMFDEIMDVDIIDGGVFGIDDDNTLVIKKGNQPIPTQGQVTIRISSIGAFPLPIPKLGHMSATLEMPLQRKILFVLPRGQSMELNPEKDIITEAVKWTDYLKYLYGVIAALLLVGAGWLVNKYRSQSPGEQEEALPVVKAPAHEIAIRDLDRLRAQELWQKGEEKAYHSELTRIMRQYVEDRYDIRALEMTTTEVKRGMSARQIDAAVTHSLVDILQIADKVKFAKGKTGPEINERFMDESYRLIDITKHPIIKDQEPEHD